MLLKDARMVIVPVPAASSKIVPYPSAASKSCAVQVAARVHDHTGKRGSAAPLNEASVVIVPLPATTSKTVPEL